MSRRATNPSIVRFASTFTPCAVERPYRKNSLILPEILLSTRAIAIDLPDGRSEHVAKCTPAFPKWRGETPADTFNGKPVLDYHGKPAFAEEYTLWSLQALGWSGVWVNSFRSQYLTSYTPAVHMALPADRKHLLARIAGSDAFPKGCWDVFAWRGEDVLFAECKLAKRDRIQDTQRRWLEKALAVGVAIESFLVVEWTFPE